MRSHRYDCSGFHSISVAATPDGSTKAKAIPLKQRDPQKAVEEEMTWMMKLYHYTPLLALRDRVVEEVRKVKAGKKSTNTSAGWGTEPSIIMDTASVIGGLIRRMAKETFISTQAR